MAARRKVYVEVNVDHRPDGTARPNRIRFENGATYEIDRIKYVCRAASTRVGGDRTALYSDDLRHRDFFV